MAFSPFIPPTTQFLPGNFNTQGTVNRFRDAFVNTSILIPIGVKQIGPFVFDYRGAESVDMVNDITDHYMEDNTARQDHIAIRPVMVTMSGIVSELVLAKSVANFISAALASVENQLSQTDAYLGKYAPGTTQTMLAAITQAQRVAIQAEQAAARVAQIASLVFPSNQQFNRVQSAYVELKALWASGALFTVATPFETLDNMAIVSIKATQPEKSNTIADFTVTMKQLRFTDNFSISAYQAQHGGRLVQNVQPRTPSGFGAGVLSPTSDVVTKFA